MKSLLAAAAAFAAASLFAVQPANRTAVVDSNGVMRWAETGDEVAVFGVNYYPPFSFDYSVLRERGIDHRETIRRDVAHFRRLGLTAMRLHCFESEISDRDGALVDNDHLDLLDYLIAECASNGMYTVLTPMAAWNYGNLVRNSRGFTVGVDMKRMTSDRAFWKVAARYEEEFASHVNRYTGRRYADDPAVLCFELINEPAYTNKAPAAEVAEFANALLDGIRRSGTRKPVLYSATWNNRNDCIPHLRTDGVTGVYYATGLRANGALYGLQLRRVRESSLKCEPRLAKMAKVVYEFDAADTPGAYMYPAMAAVFRAEGVQSATQFQYDATPIADSNDSYRTHYLNLVYTPEKAISMAIAAEVFRRTPRGTPYCPDDAEIVFPPFRVNAPLNLSEMVTGDALYYTATPKTPVADPAKLRRIWGCGSSSVVSSDGTGAYFLDRVADGLWRLQVYPDIMPIADPYTGRPGKKTVVLGRKVGMKVSLPDIGDAFCVVATESGLPVAKASDGAFAAMSGDYILSREPSPSQERLALARAADVPRYFAPPPDPPGDYRPWPPSPAECAAELRKKHVRRGDVNMLSEKVRLWTDDFRKRTFLSSRRTVCFESLALAFPEEGRLDAILVSGKALAKRAEPVELAFTMADGSVWGTKVMFVECETEMNIPATSLRHFASWDKLPDPPQGTVPDISKTVNVAFSIGLWLDKTAKDVPHGVEILSLRGR